MSKSKKVKTMTLEINELEKVMLLKAILITIKNLERVVDPVWKEDLPKYKELFTKINKFDSAKREDSKSANA